MGPPLDRLYDRERLRSGLTTRRAASSGSFPAAAAWGTEHRFDPFPLTRHRLGTVTLALVLATSPLHAQKTDVVIIENGDRITGEIKELERGKLEYSTDDIGRIHIQWDKIMHIESSKFYEIELQTGVRYYGAIGRVAETRRMVIILVQEDTLNLAQVVRITPIQLTFWEKLSGYVDVGLSLTRANRQSEWSVGTEVNYRGRKIGGGVDGTSFFRFRQDGDNSSRNSLSLMLERFLPRQWSVGVLSRVEQNQELGLDLRSSLGGGFRRDVVQTNNMDLQLLGALIINREKFATPEAGVFNAEGVVAAQYAAYTLGDNELDVDVTLSFFPSITDLGRVRSDLQARVRYEVIKDFFAGLNGFATFDTRPPTAETAKSDYAVSFTIGWSFG